MRRAAIIARQLGRAMNSKQIAGTAAAGVVAVAWGSCISARPAGGLKCTELPSPTQFTYPSTYEVRRMTPTPGYVGMPGQFSEGPTADPVCDDNYHGGVLLPDGRVVFVPTDAASVGLYDPSTNKFTLGPSVGSVDVPPRSYYGGVLLADGRVVFVPLNAASADLYDPSSNQFTVGPSVGSEKLKYVGGVQLPDGRVVFVPLGAASVGLYDPSTNEFTNGPSVTGSHNFKYFGGVLLPDGRVVFVPVYTESVGLYDPSTNKFIVGPSTGPGNDKYRGGVLLPDGRVVFVPSCAASVGLYDPSTDKFTSGPNVEWCRTGPCKTGGKDRYIGGVVLPDGRVVFVPCNSATVGLYNPSSTKKAYTVEGPLPASWDALLHPYYNK